MGFDVSRRPWHFLPTVSNESWHVPSPRHKDRQGAGVSPSSFNRVDRQTSQQRKLNLNSLRRQAQRSAAELRSPLLAATLSGSLSRTSTIQLQLSNSQPALTDMPHSQSAQLPALSRSCRGGSGPLHDGVRVRRAATQLSQDSSPSRLPVVAPPRQNRLGQESPPHASQSPSHFGAHGLGTGEVSYVRRHSRLPSIAGVGDMRSRKLSTVPDGGLDVSGESRSGSKGSRKTPGSRRSSMSSFCSVDSPSESGCSELSEPPANFKGHRISAMSARSVGSATSNVNAKRRAAYKSMQMSTVKHHSMEKAIAVFERLQSGTDHEMLRELLPQALRELSYRDINTDWVEEIATELIGETSFLNLAEFGKLLDGYNLKRLEYLRAEFPSISQDSDATRVTYEELADHLEKEGIISVPGILMELLKEHHDGIVPGAVNMNDYIYLREVFMYRAGFTQGESEAMRDLFGRYDDDDSGTMDTEELTSAVRWLGFSLQGGSDDVPDLAELTSGLNIGEQGCEFEDFLQVVKHYREKEIILARGMFSRFARLSDDNHTNPETVDIEGAAQILLALGYITSNAALIHDACDERGLGKVERLDFNDFYMMLSCLRKREGFLRSEFEDFRHAFAAHDVDGSGAVDVVELGGALRWLGYPVTVEVQQELMYDVDVDRSGEIDFDEFLKIMRWYKEGEHQNLQRAFKAGDLDGSGTLDNHEVRHLLPALGYYPLDPQQELVVKRYLRNGEVDFRQCADMIENLRVQSRKSFRETFGFTRTEMMKLKDRFNKFDHDRKGFIGQKELRLLLSEVFPEATQTREGQEKVAALLARIDADGDGTLVWSEFLHLMRQVQDREDWKWVEHEQETAKKAGFSTNEVRDLRRVFKICDSDASHSLNADEVIRMLTTIITLDHKMREKVRSMIAEVDSDGNNVLSFTEFLLLMHQVQKAHIYDLHANPDHPDGEAAPGERKGSKSMTRALRQGSKQAAQALELEREASRSRLRPSFQEAEEVVIIAGSTEGEVLKNTNDSPDSPGDSVEDGLPAPLPVNSSVITITAPASDP